MKKQIVTASDLRSGGVVFLTATGGWSPCISSALISEPSEAVLILEKRGQQAVAEQIIVGPYLIDINMENGLPNPVRFREQLRVNGPSVQTNFRKAA
ncbi:MAG: DUF2849 domain-containing protein [Gammaproteobacteria bacterium]|nr:DUF2849 domain-containing protein [Gammaproteobacteria bacterium]